VAILENEKHVETRHPAASVGPRASANGAGPKVSPAVRLHQVGKTFDNDVVAAEGVDLSVAPNEFVSIVGVSGCGKSTLLRIIAGLIPSSSGSVEVLGQAVEGPHEDVGLMFQRPALLEWKTALENVLVPIQLHRKVEREDLVEGLRLLSLFHLDGFEHHFPQQLSGGMQQRVALARLLMTGPRVRLLDEPFGAVDELTREILNLELLKIHERTASASVFVTHNIFEAVLLSDRVAVMTPRPGRIATEIDVPLPRPRSLELMTSPEFQQTATAVRESLQLPTISGGEEIVG
jgi:NitT/TauT family transport system ATP-binding protein